MRRRVVARATRGPPFRRRLAPGRRGRAALLLRAAVRLDDGRAVTLDRRGARRLRAPSAARTARPPRGAAARRRARRPRASSPTAPSSGPASSAAAGMAAASGRAAAQRPISSPANEPSISASSATRAIRVPPGDGRGSRVRTASFRSSGCRSACWRLCRSAGRPRSCRRGPRCRRRSPTRPCRARPSSVKPVESSGDVEQPGAVQRVGDRAGAVVARVRASGRGRRRTCRAWWRSCCPPR